jgi:hypothetical protein
MAADRIGYCFVLHRGLYGDAYCVSTGLYDRYVVGDG